MAEAFIVRRGGGDNLNFSVKAYASVDDLPETAKENTIAIITDAEITSWVFDCYTPSTLSEGMVWFKTHVVSSISFNALKKNTLSVNIFQVKQCVNGELVKKEGYIYQSGAWALLRTYVYNYGYINTSLVSGINGDLRSKYIYFHETLSNSVGNMSYTTTTAVDLTNYSTMTVRFRSPTSTTKVYFRAIVTTAAKDGDNVTVSGSVANTQVVSPYDDTYVTLSVDISELSGSYYLGYSWGVLTTADGDRSIYGYIYEWWLE